MAKPTASGADPLISCRLGSDTAFTTKTNIDVIKASMTIDWTSVRDGDIIDTPSPTPAIDWGIATYNEIIQMDDLNLNRTN